MIVFVCIVPGHFICFKTFLWYTVKLLTCTGSKFLFQPFIAFRWKSASTVFPWKICSSHGINWHLFYQFIQQLGTGTFFIPSLCWNCLTNEKLCVRLLMHCKQAVWPQGSHRSYFILIEHIGQCSIGWIVSIGGSWGSACTSGSTTASSPTSPSGSSAPSCKSVSPSFSCSDGLFFAAIFLQTQCAFCFVKELEREQLCF